MPSNTPPLVYLDACCFIAFFANEEGRADVIASLLEESLAKKIRVVTSVLSITEVAFLESEKSSRILKPDVEQRFDDVFNDRSIIGLIEYSKITAHKARQVVRQSVAIKDLPNIKAADAIHIASALDIGADNFFTYDEKLLRHEKTFGIAIHKPFVEQPRLDM